jgi:hypothetical protein
MPAPSMPTAVAIGPRNVTLSFTAPRRGVMKALSEHDSPSQLRVKAYAVVWYAQALGPDVDPTFTDGEALSSKQLSQTFGDSAVLHTHPDHGNTIPQSHRSHQHHRHSSDEVLEDVDVSAHRYRCV